MSKNTHPLEHERVSCWERYAAKTEQKAMRKLADEYLEFLSACKTEWETVAWAKKQLERAGFKEGLGGSEVFFTLKGKTLIAARRGKKSLADGFRLIAAHVDSPRVDFKQRPLYEDAGVAQAKTHYYGGLRKYQWFSRPLALHGLVGREDGSTLTFALGEDPKDPVFGIADLLPHLAQKQSGQVLREAFEAEKMNIILGSRPQPDMIGEAKGKAKEKPGAATPIKSHILELLNKRFGLKEEDFYSAEIHAVPAGPARYVGLDESLLGGYGHDDRVCVFLGLKAFLDGGKKGVAPAHAQFLVLWDKEEIGSEGSTGAKARFFEYCLEDCLAAWEPKIPLRRVMQAGKAISADVHGALDPDYQELHEKLNASFLGYGPTFAKFTGSRGKYEANDAHPEYVGWLRGILNKAGIPWQMAELGKVDQGGGGTVAMHFANYGMNIIDCGPAVLSMHSPFELSSKVDLYATLLAFKVFLTAK